METKIIERFSKETGNLARKCGVFISETHPLLGASPDGLTEKGCFVELKKVTSKGWGIQGGCFVDLLFTNK